MQYAAIEERHWLTLFLIDLVTDGYAVTYRHDDKEHVAASVEALDVERRPR